MNGNEKFKNSGSLLKWKMNYDINYKINKIFPGRQTKKTKDLKMINKQTFELPNFLSSNPNNTKYFFDQQRKILDHLEILEQQEFCLNLKRFFDQFPNIEELTLNADQDLDGVFSLKVLFKKSNQNEDLKEDEDHEINDFFYSNINTSGMAKLEGWKRNFNAQKNDLKSAYINWMGAENYQKWQTQVLEEKLLQQVNIDDNQSQQKRKMV